MFYKMAAGLFFAGLLFGAWADEDQQCTEDQNRGGPRIGGGGGISAGVMVIDMEPIQKIIAEDSVLNSHGFAVDNWKNMPVFGFQGFAGDRNGSGRIGFSGYLGFTHLMSNTYTRPADTHTQLETGTAFIDSVDHLYLLYTYGGFTAEKTIIRSKVFNLCVGGLLGAGAQVAIVNGGQANSAFNTVSTKDTVNLDSAAIRVAVAPVCAFDLHAGATYSITPWFHLGLNGGATMFYSSWGYGYTSSSFFTVNPMLNVKVMFGNAF